jgi:putative FmdB family regulatory protein
MPFYEYECASCKFYTEVMQKISDTPLKKCPSCGKSTLKKLISAPVFRLKGGGWYETDFKSDKESKRNLAGGDEGPDSKAAQTPPPADAKAGAQSGDSKSGDGKASDSKSDSKPAEKTSGSDPGAGGAASRSASKSSAGKPAKSAAKPAAKAPARKPAPKVKAKGKASKRRGR